MSYGLPMRLIPRAEWGAEPPRAPINNLTTPVDKVFFSCANEFDPCVTQEECVSRVKEIQQYYVTKGYDDVPYNFLVGNDGNVYEGRGWSGTPATDCIKQEEYRDKTIDIGLINGIEEITPENCDMVREAFRVGKRFLEQSIKENYVTKDYFFEGFSDEVRGPDDPKRLEDWTDNETDDGLEPTGMEEITYKPWC